MPSSPAKARKMTNIVIEETSGVDHPAHLSEGWLVTKSASKEQVADLLGIPVTKEQAVAETETEMVAKSELDAANQTIADLNEKLAKAAEPKLTEQEELLKSVPESVREQLRKSAEEAQTLREDFAKERDTRLDGEAISKSKTVYKAIGINHDEVAPALRRVAVLDADLAKSVETALKAADAQLATAGLFSVAGGDVSIAGDGSAEARLNKAATALIEAGATDTMPKAIAKAFQNDPKLYAEVQNEKAGK